MNVNVTDPIGVFDSGIGGLTVVRALMARLPFENIIYFGDTARVPYGVKSVETIALYARQITDFLLQQGVKLLIVACNTMAAVAHQAIEELSPVPVLDVIDAGARSAVAVTHTKRVGVIGTPATVNSNAYDRAIHKLDPEIRDLFPNMSFVCSAGRGRMVGSPGNAPYCQGVSQAGNGAGC